MKRERGISLTINSLASCKKRLKSVELSTVGMICSKQGLLSLMSKRGELDKTGRKVSFTLLGIV